MNHFTVALPILLATFTTFCTKPASDSASAPPPAPAPSAPETVRVAVGETAVAITAPQAQQQAGVQIAIPAVTATSTAAGAKAAPQTAGACAELAARCAKCPEGAVKMACNAALTAGSLDPRACRDGLADHDIRDLCR